VARFKLIDRQSGSFVEPARNVRIADNPESYPEVPVSSTSMYMVALIVSVLVMTVVGVLEMKWR
jgi:hypothetical protein